MKKTTANAQKKSDQIEKDVSPPVKPFDIIQGEADLLKMASEDIVKAKESMSRNEFNSLIDRAYDNISAVISSIGLSPKATKELSYIKKNFIINKFRKDLIKHNKDMYKYKTAMTRYSVRVTELTDIIEEKTSLITKLKWAFFSLLGITVLVAAFVPGGGLLVSRFWKGGFSTLHSFAGEAYGSLTSVVGGLNNAMSKNKVFDQKPPGEKRTYREILEDEIKMEMSDSTLYNKIKAGDLGGMKDLVTKVGSHISKAIK